MGYHFSKICETNQECNEKYDEICDDLNQNQFIQHRLNINTGGFMHFLIILSILTSGLHGIITHSNKKMRAAGQLCSISMALSYFQAAYFTNTVMSQNACSLRMPEFLLFTNPLHYGDGLTEA